jgi:tetratricopeptide (TPR) repeat protein
VRHTLSKRLSPLIALVGLAGCGGAKNEPRRAAEPTDRLAAVSAVSEEEPKWTRLQSEHFDVATDLSAPDATRAALALETTRAALRSAAWPNASEAVAARTSVVIFRDGLEFMHYFENVAAIFVRYVRPTIVLWGKPDYWEQKTGLNAEASSSLLRHELTHRLASGVYARQPTWFAEGLAQFLETMTVSEDGSTATLGEADPEALRRYKRYRVHVSEALAWRSYTDSDPETIAGLYGISWLMVHFLHDNRGNDFDAFQNALVQGVDPEAAWKKSLGTLRPEVLDAQLRDYVQHADFKKVAVPIERTAVAPATNAVITEADVHAIRAQLAISGSQTRPHAGLDAEAQREIESALALEPANPLAVRLLLATGRSLPKNDLTARLHAHLEKRPDDGEAWLLLAEHGIASEREAAARKAAKLMPANPDACVILAWYLAASGRAEEALAVAVKATSLAPWDARGHYAHAEALFGVGRCTDAIRAETRAIDVLPDDRASSQFAEELRHKLDLYKRSCAKSKHR